MASRQTGTATSILRALLTAAGKDIRLRVDGVSTSVQLIEFFQELNTIQNEASYSALSLFTVSKNLSTKVIEKFIHLSRKVIYCLSLVRRPMLPLPVPIPGKYINVCKLE